MCARVVACELLRGYLWGDVMVGTPVIFRIDKYGKDKQVTAVFPYEESTVGKPWLRTCYAHIGQHGACDKAWVYEYTRPATPEEYAPLKKELERMGYSLQVLKRGVKWYTYPQHTSARKNGQQAPVTLACPCITCWSPFQGIQRAVRSVCIRCGRKGIILWR